MNFYLSLDDILDTRLGVLNTLSMHYPKRMLANNWHFRSSDREILDLCQISNDTWNEAYGKRTARELKNSIVTNLLTFIRKDIMTDIINFPEMEEMSPDNRIFLNVYPYDLTKEEINSMEKVLRYQLPNFSRVEVIKLAPKLITPSWIQSKGIYYFFNYDGIKWLNIHDEALINDPLTKVKMFLPAMEAINAEPVTEEMSKQHSDQNRFDLVGLMWAPYLTLQFIPTKEFCIIANVKEKT